MSTLAAAPGRTGSRTGRSAPVLRLAHLLLPAWRRLLPAVVVAAGSELAAAGLMVTAAWLITRAAQEPLIASVSVAIVVVRALALGRGVLRYGERLLGHDGALRAVAGFRMRVFEALVPLAPAGTPAFRSGDLLTRLVDDVDAAQDLLLRVLLPVAGAVAVGAAATGTAVVLLPAAGLVLGSLLLVAAVLVPAVVLFSARGAGRDRAAARAELAAGVVDLTRGAADLAAYGARARVADRVGRAGARLARVERRRAAVTSAATAVRLLLQAVALVVVVWTALRARGAGSLPVVDLTVLAVLVLVAFEALEPLAGAAFRLAEVRARAARLVALFDARPPVVEPTAAAPLESEGPVGVRITGLTVRHAGRLEPALDGVSVDLAPGRRTVLVGASGSGKSTLIAVLMRFVDYEAGSVRVGGRELRECAGGDVRRVVTGMTQDAHLFDASVRANLLVGRPDATDAELCEAARRARILDWIESLPRGFDARVGLGGAQVSGGQRTRLLLARALLADPPVLVLDEPTEGLDPQTASAVLADILDATRGRTTLLVTHELAGLDGADRVVRLDQGRVVASTG